MFVALFAVVPVLLQSPAASQPGGEPLPVQFALRTEAMKQHASVVDNELTITAGANEPYLSSVPVGDFEASGEIAMPADSRAALHLCASIDEDARAHSRIQIPLPAMPDGWQPMTVASLGGHIRVVIAGRPVAEREVEVNGSGLFGFEVSTGQLSLRRWRVVRHDVSSGPPPGSPTDVLDARRLPPGAQMPRLLHEVKPQYTTGAMRRKVQGVVDVQVVVEADGSVRPLRVTRSLDEELDTQAVDAVKQWMFEPALVDGKPVACVVSIQLSFTLRGR